MNNLLDALIAAKLAGGSGGGGGGGEVTPAAVASAISQMTNAQAEQALADLGYTIDSVIDANSGNPVQNRTLALAFLTAQDELYRKADKTIVVEIDSTTPTITPAANTIYKCGELSSLTVSNPPATGAYSIVFTSGATATVTAFPASILGLESFAAEANTIYEINVLDNRAVWMGWPLPEVTV